MTCRFIDSFDHYSTAQMGTKYSAVGAGVGSNSDGIGAYGRNSTKGCRLTYVVSSSFGKTLDNQATWVVGFAAKYTGLRSAPVFYVQDAGTPQVSIVLNVDGTMSARRRDNSGTLLGTTTYALPLNAFHYIEIKIVISDTVGTVDIHVDGTSVLSLTGQDTKATANAYANNFTIWIPGGSPWWGDIVLDVDDLYIFDGTGTTCKDFVGDSRVDFNPIAADGADTGWAVTGAATKHAACATNPGDPTKYIATSTVPDSYTGTVSAVGTGTIRAVQTIVQMEKDVAGVATAVPIIRHSGTDNLGATMTPGAGAYTIFTQPFDVNPGTGVAWTSGDITSDEFGVKRTT